MTGSGPFFSDPRPIHSMGPDDPRPIHSMGPDDPRPIHSMGPDDPRPIHSMGPDDPGPVNLMEPDDPRPIHSMGPDDPRPIHSMGPDDPAALALQILEERCRTSGRAGEGPRAPAVGRSGRFPLEHSGLPLEHSGRVVIRLSEELDLPSVDEQTNLWHLARELGLGGLKRVLRKYRVESDSTARLVDLEDPRPVPPAGGSGSGTTGDAGDGQGGGEAAGATGGETGDDVPVDEQRPRSDGEEGAASEAARRRALIAGWNLKVQEAQRERLWQRFEAFMRLLRRLWPKGTEVEVLPTVRELEERAAHSELPPIHSLASYWRVDVSSQQGDVSPGPDVGSMIRDLNELPEVDLAYRELAAKDPGNGVTTSDTYGRVQEYLDRAPAGIDARWVWRQLTEKDEVDSARVGFADLEQGWIGHEDTGLESEPKIDDTLVFGVNRHEKGEYRGHHGTAVLGEVVGLHSDDGTGIEGIVRHPRWVLLSSHYTESVHWTFLDGEKTEGSSGSVANAIRFLIPLMEKGDVLLLEVQRSYLPTEVDPLDRDAIRLAVAHGIVVIEAAGNGNTDLDLLVDEQGERVLDRRHPEYIESGALMVAAATAALPHNRLWGRVGVGSNYGTRIDCYAHGDRVVTSGYGDLNAYLADPGDRLFDDPSLLEGEAAESAYSAYFGGTSGAAPIIAGAAMLVQQVHKARTGVRLSPWEMRRLLSDPATGTPQGWGVAGRIGVMPDLRLVLREPLALTSNLYLREDVEGDGGVPVPGRTSCSPDIVVRKVEKTADGHESGGAPDPLDDDPESLSQFVANGDYEVYVRLHNRGLQKEHDPEIQVYRSPVATLVTPDMWQPICHLAPAASTAAMKAKAELVLAHGQPEWIGPLEEVDSAATPHPHARLVGTAGSQTEDESQRYCFTAIVRDGRDHEMFTPPDRWPYFDWRRYRAFLRWQNNVACRNVHRAGPKDELSFDVTGSPDMARSFDLEIVRNLPGGTELKLLTHPALASALRQGRLWGAEREPAGVGVWLTLPRRPRLRIRGVRLLAGARFGSRFRVGKGVGSGHSLAIRQLYRGQEVGRITWRFAD